MTVLLTFEIFRASDTEEAASLLRREFESALRKLNWEDTPIHTTFTKTWISPKDHKVTEELSRALSTARKSSKVKAAKVKYLFLSGLGPATAGGF